jgi:cleavage and polyadenylation specificity factor subunit 2
MDGRKILLDCGWDDRMDVQALEPLRRIAPHVDAVLISHPDTAHLGALPYAFGTLGMACKVYATLPVHKMGMMFMYDQFLARSAEGDFDLFSLDDVDRAFGAFVPVRYAQHSALDLRSRENETDETAGKTEDPQSGGSEVSEATNVAVAKKTSNDSRRRFSGITVTAYAAGHTLGGAVWKVHKDAEDVVYAVDYNHRREKHLNGTTLDSINRPSLLITDAFNARGEPPPKTRDDDLMKAVLRAVRSDGNVLVPVDPAGRVLELLLLLEERWAKQQLGAYQLVLLTTVAYNTMEFARSHLEWMGENVGRNFDRDRLNAFNTRYLTLCHSLDELKNLRPGPKVVLASFGSLDAGPARALFTEWAEDPKNLIVLTNRGAPGSLSRDVRVLAEQPPGARKPLEVEISRRVLLDGAELEAWRLKRKDERLSKQARLEAEKEKERLEAEEKEKEEKVHMDVDETAHAEEPAAAAAAESLLGVAQISGAGTRAAELRRRRCLIDGFEVPASAAAPMFPDEVWDPQVDDFGEAVDAEVFARAVSMSARAAGASDAAIAQAEGAAKAAADAAGAATIAAREKKAIPPPAPPPMPEEVPSKILLTTKTVHLRAAVHCCDYEGRADGRSVKTLVARVEPRRVVLVHGTDADTEHLRSTLVAAMPGVEVTAPRAGEAVECTSDTAAYKLELSQELLQRTRLRDCAGYQVGWVDGFVGFAKDAAGEDVPVLMAPPKEAVEAGRREGGEGEGEGLGAASTTPSTTPSRPVTPSRGGEDALVTSAAAAVAVATAASEERRLSAFVGDLKLTDFKIALASAGVAAEFRGGALVCAGGTVCVRKSADSENLQVEGALSDAFYRVRDILYASYQI